MNQRPPTALHKHPLTWTAVLLAALLFLSGTNGALWGNLLMVSVTIGIFVGTLSLGRRADARAPASQSASSRH